MQARLPSKFLNILEEKGNEVLETFLVKTVEENDIKKRKKLK